MLRKKRPTTLSKNTKMSLPRTTKTATRTTAAAATAAATAAY
jgi:hypothetical protein